jgi:hypothetical protein
MSITSETSNLTSLYSVFDDLCVPIYVGAGGDKLLVFLWTLSREASRSAIHALSRLFKAGQQAVRKFVK